MKSLSTPFTFDGDEKIELNDCYVFRDNLAHKASVSYTSGISFTEHPNLLIFNIVVPGSKKNTLSFGIPLKAATKLFRQVIVWNEATDDYSSLRQDVVQEVFQRHIPDLVSAPWTEEDIETLEQMEATDELQEMVKEDLLRIAAVSMEANKDE